MRRMVTPSELPGDWWEYRPGRCWGEPGCVMMLGLCARIKGDWGWGVRPAACTAARARAASAVTARRWRASLSTSISCICSMHNHQIAVLICHVTGAPSCFGRHNCGCQQSSGMCEQILVTSGCDSNGMHVGVDHSPLLSNI